MRWAMVSIGFEAFEVGADGWVVVAKMNGVSSFPEPWKELARPVAENFRVLLQKLRAGAGPALQEYFESGGESFREWKWVVCDASVEGSDVIRDVGVPSGFFVVEWKFKSCVVCRGILSFPFHVPFLSFPFPRCAHLFFMCIHVQTHALYVNH